MTKSATSNIPSFVGNPKYSHTLLLAPIGGKSSVFLANSAISTYPELLIITAESTQMHTFLLCGCAQKKHVVINSKRFNYRDRDSEFFIATIATVSTIAQHYFLQLKKSTTWISCYVFYPTQ